MLKDPAVLRTIGLDPLEWQSAVASGRTITSPSLYPWLDELIRGADAVVVDGYPRAANSAAPFAALVQSLPRDRDVLAILFDCPTTVTHPRLKVRARADDDERVTRRDEEYERVQLPLFRSLPSRVRRVEVDGSRAAPEILADVEAVLGRSGQGARN